MKSSRKWEDVLGLLYEEFTTEGTESTEKTRQRGRQF
jgi:hypothetical protein